MQIKSCRGFLKASNFPRCAGTAKQYLNHLFFEIESVRKSQSKL
jgi:hypothetical protein